MSRYKSEQIIYNSQKKKNVPIWRLDTNIVTVTHFNADTLTEEHKTYHIDYIRYHLHYSDSKYPDRLRRLVNEGKIIEYLDDLELKVCEAIIRQVERWKKSDSCYQTAVAILRRCTVLKIALSVWQERSYLSVWFIFEFGLLCLDRYSSFIILFFTARPTKGQSVLLHFII